MTRDTLRTAARSALATAFCLPLGLAGGFAVGAAVFDGLPGHMADSAKTTVAAVLALGVLAVGGAGWGRLMARITGSDRRRQMALAGALGYAAAVLVAGSVLTGLEIVVVQNGGGPDLPLHVIFTFLFTPAIAIVAAAGGLALGVAAQGGRSGVRAAVLAGLAGGLAFLAVDLLLDAIGFRVGAPGAAERATMITVAFSGSTVAALVGGAAIGLSLVQNRLGHSNS